MRLYRAAFKDILLAALILLVPAGCANAMTQSMLKFSNLNEALASIESRYKVLVGFELAADDSGRAPLALDLSDGDVARAFDNLVVQRPAYSWRLEDGVYELYPKTNPQNLSDLVIRNYSVHETTLEEASNAISNVPEFSKWLSDLNLKRREFDLGGSHRSSQRISINLNDVPLRRILNRLLKEAAMKEWDVVRYGDKKEFVALYFHGD